MSRMRLMWVVAVLAVAPMAWAQSASDLLEKGVYQEEVVGNLSAAMELYQQVVSDAQSNRQVVAQALLRMANCQLRLDDPAKARTTSRQLIRQYPDQLELVKQAQELLDEQLRLDPASLMPPGTFYYVEIGDPGRQVVTLSQMLEGTPYANPLMALQPTSQPAGAGPTPAAMMAALLNPSMIEEFKKVRGCAIGITGSAARGSQPMVMVLQPGESDALRGLIQAIIGMSGAAKEPVEGMTVVDIKGQAACAYDDTVVLAASPPEQLTEVIRRYKRIGSDPSLSGNNSAFAAQAPASERRKDAFTIWMDPAKARPLMEQMRMSGSDIQLLYGLLDFPNIQGVLVRGVLDPQQPHLAMSGAFGPEHHCLPYRMLRTPPLTGDGFAGVPAEAVAVAAIALSDQDQTPLAAIQQATGLDIGRELFANLRQVCLFVVPAEPSEQLATLNSQSPLLGNMGLVLTSHDPQRTLTMLDELLRSVNVAFATSAPAAGQPQGDSSLRQYAIGGPNGSSQTLYLAQQGNTTILSLNPAIAEQGRRSAASGQNVTNAGPLGPGMAALPAQSSKIAVVNAGRMLSLLDAQVGFTESMRSQLPDGTPPLQQLAVELDQTLVSLHTQETPDRLDAYLGVASLPALKNLLPPLMAHMQAMQQMRGKARQSQTAPARSPYSPPQAVSVTSGNWNDPQTWRDQKVPDGSNEVKIGAAHAIEGINVTIPSNYEASALRLYVYNPAVSTLTISPGASLSIKGWASTMKIGFNTDADGVCIHDGLVFLEDGTDLVVGDGGKTRSQTADGHYYLRDGMLSCDQIVLGVRNGSGSLYQSGGLVTCSQVSIGSQPGSKGLYSLTGGTIQTNALGVTDGVLELAKGASVSINGPVELLPGATLRMIVSAEGIAQIQDIAGDITLVPGSSLDMKPADGFTPNVGAEYGVLRTGAGAAVIGTFTNVSAGWSVKVSEDRRALSAKYVGVSSPGSGSNGSGAPEKAAR